MNFWFLKLFLYLFFIYLIILYILYNYIKWVICFLYINLNNNISFKYYGISFILYIYMIYRSKFYIFSYFLIKNIFNFILYINILIFLLNINKS